MSISNPIYAQLETMEDKLTYPHHLENNISDTIENKYQYYSDIIRMNTSDRNKAKSTISILNKVFYGATRVIQLIYGALEDKVPANNTSESLYIFNRTTSSFNEVLDGVEPVVCTVKNEDDDDVSLYAKKFVDLYDEVLRARLTPDTRWFTLSDIIDVIVHGELHVNPGYNERHPFPKSKLVTEYINHLEFVTEQLTYKPVTYLKEVIRHYELQQD